MNILHYELLDSFINNKLRDQLLGSLYLSMTYFIMNLVRLNYSTKNYYVNFIHK
jgi:hypothetical protein